MHTDIDDCLPNPCQNNGTCTDFVNEFQCTCVAGFNGTNCESSKNFIFLLFFFLVFEIFKSYFFIKKKKKKRKSWIEFDNNRIC